MVSLDIISGNADSSAFKTRRISRYQRFENKMNVNLSFDFFQLSNFKSILKIFISKYISIVNIILTSQ